MNELIAVPYEKAPDRRKIRDLYVSSFPKDERLPWWILRLPALLRGVEITGYYENDRLCGFAYTVSDARMLFVLFFAVHPAVRGNGYGTSILHLMKMSHPGKTVLLNIEPLDENAENYEERVRRFRFYEKNGFFDTGYHINEIGGKFRVLASTPEIDPQAYQGIFTKWSGGLWKPRIAKANHS